MDYEIPNAAAFCCRGSEITGVDPREISHNGYRNYQ
jgi:hypothetical protein